MKLRTDISHSALPRRNGQLPKRTDIAASALPRRVGVLPRRSDIPASALPGGGMFSIVTEWFGKLAALLAVALFVLVMLAIDKGLTVQDSARRIVHDFRVTNDFFANRADLTAPETAKKELQTLATVLVRLNGATERAVTDLAATLPDVRNLLAAGRGDVTIAKQLVGVGTTLQGAAGDLNKIAAGADTTVSTVDGQLSDAISLVNQLNAELGTTERKLALLPATGGNAK